MRNAGTRQSHDCQAPNAKVTPHTKLRHQLEKAEGLARLDAIKRKLTPERERTPAGPQDVVDTFMDSPERMVEE